MNTISRACAGLACSLLIGCSTFQSTSDQQACEPAAEAPACPVCPVVEPEPVQCPPPQVVEKIVEVPTPPAAAPATTATEKHLPIVGAVEWATVEPANIRMEARIDTGSATSSLQAEDIQLVEKDGKRWVHFYLRDPATDDKVPVEERLRRKLVKKSADSEREVRYVIRLWISLGESRMLADITLNDREMEFPLLLGRNVLVDTMIVDVSRQYVISE